MIDQLFAHHNESDLIVHKIKNEADLRVENTIIKANMNRFQSHEKYLSAIKCAEILQNNSFIVDIAQGLGVIESLKDQIIADSAVIQNVEKLTHSRIKKVSQRARFGIPDDSNQTWNLKLPERVRDKPSNEKIEFIETINRLNLGYDEAAFTYVS